MRTYLLATDGSDPASRALNYLLDTARREDSITLVHVIPNPAEGFLGHDYDSNVAEARLREAAESVTDPVETRLVEAGFETDTVVLMGNTGEEICGLAEDMDVDTIVMGRRGKNAVSELLLGSVSHYVVHHAPCAVTVVPAQ